MHTIHNIHDISTTVIESHCCNFERSLNLQHNLTINESIEKIIGHEIALFNYYIDYPPSALFKNNNYTDTLVDVVGLPLFGMTHLLTMYTDDGLYWGKIGYKIVDCYLLTIGISKSINMLVNKTHPHFSEAIFNILSVIAKQNNLTYYGPILPRYPMQEILIELNFKRYRIHRNSDSEYDSDAEYDSDTDSDLGSEFDFECFDDLTITLLEEYDDNVRHNPEVWLKQIE